MKTRLPPEVKSELLMLSNVVGKVSETLDYSNRYCLKLVYTSCTINILIGTIKYHKGPIIDHGVHGY